MVPSGPQETRVATLGSEEFRLKFDIDIRRQRLSAPSHETRCYHELRGHAQLRLGNLGSVM